jgi:hypothetical protein
MVRATKHASILGPSAGAETCLTGNVNVGFDVCHVMWLSAALKLAGLHNYVCVRRVLVLDGFGCAAETKFCALAEHDSFASPLSASRCGCHDVGPQQHQPTCKPWSDETHIAKRHDEETFASVPSRIRIRILTIFLQLPVADVASNSPAPPSDSVSILPQTIAIDTVDCSSHTCCPSVPHALLIPISQRRLLFLLLLLAVFVHSACHTSCTSCFRRGNAHYLLLLTPVCLKTSPECHGSQSPPPTTPKQLAPSTTTTLPSH